MEDETEQFDDENIVEINNGESEQMEAEDPPNPPPVATESATGDDVNTLAEGGDSLKSGVYFSPERLKFNPNGNPFVVVINPDEWDDVAVMESVMSQLSNSYLQDKRVYAKLVETLAMAVRTAPNIIRSALESPEALQNWVKSIGRSVNELVTQGSDVSVEVADEGVALEPTIETSDMDQQDAPADTEEAGV